MADDEGDPPDDGGVDNPEGLELFDPELIRDMMEGAINAVVREQGLLSDAWDELEARELVLGIQMRRIWMMAPWLGLILTQRSERRPDNDNARA